MIELIETIKQKNPGIFLACQLAVNLVLVVTVILTLISYISPHWFNSPLQQEVRGFATEYMVYSPETNPNIKAKSLNIFIDETDINNYSIADTDESDYYFKITPLIDQEQNTDITHEIVQEVLEIGFETKENHQRDILERLIRETSLIVGSSTIPLDLNITVENQNPLNISLQEHRINTFTAIFKNSDNNISLSKKSLPKNFNVTVESGITKFDIPEGSTYAMNYSVAEDAQLFVNRQEITGNGLHRE